MRLLVAFLLHATVHAPRPWAERLADRTGQPHTPAALKPPPTPPLPPSPQLPPNPPSIDQITEELRRFITAMIEPAIAALRVHELSHASNDTCFATPGGQHVRHRCCVYFTVLAAALLEERYGPTATEHPLTGNAPSVRQLYPLLARWFLQPPPHVDDATVTRAAALQAAAGRDGYDLDAMRADAAGLPGPLGRYAAPIVLLGVHGTLWRCEVSSVHTYLVFTAAGLADVVIDVSIKQFVVLSEWMEERPRLRCWWPP